MIGKVFSRLTVIGEAPSKKPSWEPLWVCKCVCGNQKTTKGALLRSGETKSCGCLRLELIAEQGRKKRKHGGSGTRIYQAWKNMHSRCKATNPESETYKNYVARGITVCKAWADFNTFKRWALKNGYRDDLTLDRKNNDKGYSPQNCRWATQLQQIKNQRPRKNRKLSDEQIKAIFLASGKQREIAAAYGTDQCCVWQIKNRKRFSHITQDLTSQ